MGVLAYGLKTAGSPLFETVMALTVAAVGMFFGIAYLRRVPECTWREGLYLGTLLAGHQHCDRSAFIHVGSHVNDLRGLYGRYRRYLFDISYHYLRLG